MAYANAYLPSAETGTVADEEGRISLQAQRIAAASDTTPVTISAVGFRDTTLDLGALRRQTELQLVTADYTLAEATITAAAFTAAKRAGLRVRMPPLSKCLMTAERGQEWGTAFEVGDACALDALQLDLSYRRRGPIVLELNVYAVDSATARPTARLHSVPIRHVVPPRARGRYRVPVPADLGPIVVDGWVAVTLEQVGGGASVSLDISCKGAIVDVLRGGEAADASQMDALDLDGGPQAIIRTTDGTWRFRALPPAIEAYLRCVE